jgi:two-component system CheB/CheR fusion protein
VRRDGLQIRSGHGWKPVSIEIIPLTAGGRLHYLVLFDDQEGRKAPAAASRKETPHAVPAKGADKKQHRFFQRELAANREYLQSIIQELEAANEELQSANEEILSSNEELQSTNEELDTAKEELQSTNEELTTVNEEMHGRNEELSRVNGERTALAGRLISIQEEERRRIGRELHDNIGQHLTGLRLQLDAIALEGGLGTVLQARIDAARSVLQEIDKSLDFVAAELRPPGLELGLTSALKQFVRQWSATFGIPATFHGLGPAEPVLTLEGETHVYRVIQEALHNAFKHAGASRVRVTLERRVDDLFLLVQDDGCGFKPDTGTRRGLGLLSIRERAVLVGGESEVESVVGKGTIVSLRLPKLTWRSTARKHKA